MLLSKYESYNIFSKFNKLLLCCLYKIIVKHDTIIKLISKVDIILNHKL